MDCSFPSFLNMYLFLFNTQLLVRVEVIDICHLLFGAVLSEWGIVGLTGFSGCKWSPVEDVYRKNLSFFSRMVLSVGLKENFKLHYVSTLICWVIILCHSCVSIRFISRSGILSIVVYWILIGWVGLGHQEWAWMRGKYFLFSEIAKTIVMRMMIITLKCLF